MEFFNNWLIQVLVVCLLTVNCLGCAPATAPREVTNSIPRSGTSELTATCNGEKCRLLHEGSFTIIQNACEKNGQTIDISVDGTDKPGATTMDGPTGNVTVHCENGVLTSSGGGVNVTDISTLACSSDCVLKTTDLETGVEGFGTCTTAMTTATCIESAGATADTTTGDKVCDTTKRVVFTTKGGTEVQAPKDPDEKSGDMNDEMVLTCESDGTITATYTDDDKSTVVTAKDVYQVSCVTPP